MLTASPVVAVVPCRRFIVAGILFKFAIDRDGIHGSDDIAAKEAGHQLKVACGLCPWCARMVPARGLHAAARARGRMLEACLTCLSMPAPPPAALMRHSPGQRGAQSVPDGSYVVVRTCTLAQHRCSALTRECGMGLPVRLADFSSTTPDAAYTAHDGDRPPWIPPTRHDPAPYRWTHPRVRVT